MAEKKENVSGNTPKNPDKKKEVPAGVVETQREVAEYFGVKTRTVQYWIQDGMPTREDGLYDLTDIRAWRLANGAKGKSESSQEKEKHEADYRKYKALLAELDYKEKLGLLIPKHEVEQGRVQRITIIKRSLESFGRRVAPQLVGLEVPEMEVLIDKRMAEIIDAFADGRENEVMEQKPKGTES